MADEPQVLPQDNKFVDATKVDEIVASKTAEVTEKLTQDFDTKLDERTQTIQKDAEAGAVKKATDALVDKLVDKPEAKTTWDKEGRRPKDHTEVALEGAKLAEERVMARIKAEQETKDKKVTADKVEIDKRQKEYSSQINKNWDSQLDSLVTQGLIPKVDEENQKKYDDAIKMANGAEKNKILEQLTKEDDGIRMRQEVQRQASINHSQADRDAGILPNMELSYYKYVQNKKPAGATAPVFGASKSVSSPAPGSYAYEDLQDGNKPKPASEVYQEEANG